MGNKEIEEMSANKTGNKDGLDSVSKKGKESSLEENLMPKKPLSEEGKRITKKLEEMTGIKLMDDEDIHNNDNTVDNLENKNLATDTKVEGNKNNVELTDNVSRLKNAKAKASNLESEGSESSPNDGKEGLQNVKDVDLGENDANTPLVFKCPNDLRLTLKKENGEYVIDEDCCTVISLLVKNTGEIATNFSGAHSPNLVKILERSLKRYLKELKKTLKKEYKIANDELTLSSEPLDEDKKWQN